MAFDVIIEAPLGQVRSDVQVEMQARFHQIAVSLDRIPRGAAGRWNALVFSGLVLDLKGWRFEYCIDHRRNALVVGKALFKAPSNQRAA